MRSLMVPDGCLLNVDALGMEALLTRMVGALADQSVVGDPGMVLSLLLEREKLGSTAIGKGVAIPHARSLAVSSLKVAMATAPDGIPWGVPAGEPVHLVFLVLAPSMERARKPYLDLIARIAERTQQARDRRRLLKASSFEEVVAALEERR